MAEEKYIPQFPRLSSQKDSKGRTRTGQGSEQATTSTASRPDDGLYYLSNPSAWPSLSSSSEAYSDGPSAESQSPYFSRPSYSKVSSLSLPKEKVARKSSLEALPGGRHCPGSYKQQHADIYTEDIAKRFENSALMMTVAAIAQHDAHKLASPTASDVQLECSLLTDGYVSVLLVTEAVAIILAMDVNIRKELKLELNDLDVLKYFKKFLQMQQTKYRSEIESLPKAYTVIGIRHSLAHANAEYVLEPKSTKRGVKVVALYRREQPKNDEDKKKNKEYIKVYSCTPEEFTWMCATLRKLFLCWEKATEYLPPKCQALQAQEREQMSLSKREEILEATEEETPGSVR